MWLTVCVMIYVMKLVSHVSSHVTQTEYATILASSTMVEIDFERQARVLRPIAQPLFALRAAAHLHARDMAWRDQSTS